MLTVNLSILFSSSSHYGGGYDFQFLIFQSSFHRGKT